MPTFLKKIVFLYLIVLVFISNGCAQTISPHIKGLTPLNGNVTWENLKINGTGNFFYNVEEKSIVIGHNDYKGTYIYARILKQDATELLAGFFENRGFKINDFQKTSFLGGPATITSAYDPKDNEFHKIFYLQNHRMVIHYTGPKETVNTEFLDLINNCEII